MTATIGEETKIKRDQVKKMILGKILVGLGFTLANEWIESGSLATGDEVLSQCRAKYPARIESENPAEKLLHEGMSIWANWPTAGPEGDSACIFVVLGELVARQFTTAVSSRLGRSLEQHPQWFDALRTYCLQLDRDVCLLTSPGQFTHRYLQRLADWIPISQTFLLQSTTDTFGQRQIEVQAFRDARPSQVASFVIRVVASTGDLVGADQSVAALCGEVRALHVRPNGNIEKMLCARLASASEFARRTLILTTDASARPKHVARLFDQGAIAWHVYDPKIDANVPNGPDKIARPVASKFLWLTDIDPNRYVSHFTRRQKCGWLDEGEAKFLDSLLFGGSNPERGPLATLFRIVLQRQLISNNRLTRDSSRVVCFTNRALSEFEQLRSFRSHLARWDFEPYGIAIDRSVLIAAGGRPVEYGTEVDWLRMPAERRPFFQLGEPGKSSWEFEDEWRYVGDFDLGKIAADQVIVFVANEKDAREIALVSPWPILVLQK